MDFSIKLSNGMILSGMVQSPGENARGMIILVHGLGEHIQRYSNWAELFKNKGIGFIGVDMPGHGRSPGRKGHISGFALVKEMIDILLNTSRQTFPGIPLYLYGHSLGGGLVLNYLVRTNPKVNGAIITSPWLKLAFEPPRSKLALASVLNHIVPGFVQSSGLNPDFLSHDPEVVKRYKNDPLVHGKISVSLFNIAVKAAKFTLENASSLKVRTLLLHGSDDKICSPEGSREFAANSAKADLKIFEGGYHELHNEPFKIEVFDYIIKWVENKL
jgi:alpha-beta hydrolase superfamily lysophospholipase